jgi:hypothetical protein
MAALFYSLSRVLAGGGSPTKSQAELDESKTGTSKGSPPKPKASLPGIHQKSSVVLEGEEESGTEDVGRLSHRLSRPRTRFPKDPDHRHPLYLSRSRNRSPAEADADDGDVTFSPPRSRLDSNPTESVLEVPSTEQLKISDFSSNLSRPASRTLSRGSKSRSRSRRTRHIMWEDSGYDSPSLKTDRSTQVQVCTYIA